MLIWVPKLGVAQCVASSVTDNIFDDVIEAAKGKSTKGAETGVVGEKSAKSSKGGPGMTHPIPVVPVPRIPVPAIPLPGVPVRAVPVRAVPVRAVPVHAVPVRAVPAVPVHVVPVRAVPGVPVRAVPGVPVHAVPVHAVPGVPVRAVPDVPDVPIPDIPSSSKGFKMKSVKSGIIKTKKESKKNAPSPSNVHPRPSLIKITKEPKKNKKMAKKHKKMAKKIKKMAKKNKKMAKIDKRISEKYYPSSMPSAIPIIVMVIKSDLVLGTDSCPFGDDLIALENIFEDFSQEYYDDTYSEANFTVKKVIMECATDQVSLFQSSTRVRSTSRSRYRPPPTRRSVESVEKTLLASAIESEGDRDIEDRRRRLQFGVAGSLSNLLQRFQESGNSFLQTIQTVTPENIESFFLKTSGPPPGNGDYDFELEELKEGDYDYNGDGEGNDESDGDGDGESDGDGDGESDGDSIITPVMQPTPALIQPVIFPPVLQPKAPAPIVAPILPPTNLPTLNPSVEPSANPSLSGVPSSKPSMLPSLSGNPSSKPSLAPTASVVPTTSFDIMSENPSERPTNFFLFL